VTLRERRVPTLAAWAPDGRSLAIVEGDARVVVRTPAGKLLRIVARANGTRHSLANPTWSPDGHWIGFERHDSGGADGRGCCTDTYRVVPATGGEERTVLTIHDGGIHDSPGPVFWSPDSTRIAFTTDGRDSRDPLLGIVDVRTTAVRRPSPFAFRAPVAWSPDGKHLAVASAKGLVLLDPTGGQITPLAPPKAGESASFSPDGRLLAIVWGRSGANGVEVIGVPGAPHRRAVVVTAPRGFAVTASGWSR
jgi:Tol biopolymer transport system component